jgi:hypothetical protein
MSALGQPDPQQPHHEASLAIREHLKRRALSLTEQERSELIARIDAEIEEIDRRASAGQRGTGAYDAGSP